MMDALSSNQHTKGHYPACPACERAMDMTLGNLSPELTFREAFRIWISDRIVDDTGTSNARFIGSRTARDLRQYARAAGKFFDDIPLSKIHVGNLREYQKLRATNPHDPNGSWFAERGKSIEGPFETRELAEARARERGDGFTFRQTAWERRAGANLIRKEIGVVIRVMAAAGAWTAHHEDVFEPLLPVESDVPQALTPQEQHTWLHTAGSRAEWRVPYWWSVIALQTTCSTNELRALRLGDIFLGQGIINVRSEGAKNKFRIRTIPLQTDQIVWAFDQLIARARRRGASQPSHYLFPRHIVADKYNAALPMSVWGMRKPWDAIRKASGLDWFLPRHLRHTAITRMAEAGTPIHVIMEFAGHIRPAMQRHYIAISMNAKRRWAAAAWMGAEMPHIPGAWSAPEPLKAAV